MRGAPYASQESVAETLTQFELGAPDAHAFGASAPFAMAPPDGEPLPKRTREPVIVEGGIVTAIDPRTGEALAMWFDPQDAGGGP